MSNKRWNSAEKIELMKLFSSGKSYDDISTILNRSPNAIKLRLEAIVYTNLIKGKTLNMLTKMLNTDAEKIKQLYYSHKSFRQSRGESVKDIAFDPEPVGDTSGSNVGGSTVRTQTLTNNVSRPTPKAVPGTIPGTIPRAIPRTMPGTIPRSRQITTRSLNNPQFGGNTNNNASADNMLNDKGKLQKLETENHVLEEIIKNYRMKRHLRKLYVDGKLDKHSVRLYKKVLDKSSQ